MRGGVKKLWRALRWHTIRAPYSDRSSERRSPTPLQLVTLTRDRVSEQSEALLGANLSRKPLRASLLSSYPLVETEEDLREQSCGEYRTVLELFEATSFHEIMRSDPN